MCLRILLAGCLMFAAASKSHAAHAPPPPPVSERAADVEAAESQQPSPPPEMFSGQVVFLKDALKRRELETAEETAQHVVLETDSGDLIPILADWRGRAFYQDEHLRNRKVELIAFRHPGVPYLNVLSIYTFDEKDRRNYTDYWCDICAIPMYEIQDCECCQGPIRLRFQLQDLPDYIARKSPPAR